MLVLGSCIAVMAALGLPAVAAAAVELPPGFPAAHRLQRPDVPDGRALRPRRARLRRREVGPDPRLRRGRRRRGDAGRRPAPGGLQLQRPRAAGPGRRPAVPGPARTSTRCTPATPSPGGAAPYWGEGPTYENEDCPGAPQVSAACIVSGRLVKITVNPATNVAVGAPQTLVDDWCSEFLSHSVGDLAFGADGAAVRERRRRRGLRRRRLRPEGTATRATTRAEEPGDLTPPSAEGGALRSQDLRTPGDPSGSTGRSSASTRTPAPPSPGNPLALASADVNARRIVADGLRNPFRFAVRPGYAATSGSATWAGAPGRRSTALPTPAARARSSRTSAGRATRATRCPAAPSRTLYGATGSTWICERPLRGGRGRGHGADVLLLPRHERDGPEPVRAGACRGARVVQDRLVRDGHGLLHHGRLRLGVRRRPASSPTTRGGASGSWASTRTGPTRRRSRSSPRTPTSRSTSSAAPAATSSTSDIVGGEVHRIERSTLTVSLSAEPDLRRRAAPGHADGDRRRQPGGAQLHLGPRRRRHLRRPGQTGRDASTRASPSRSRG